MLFAENMTPRDPLIRNSRHTGTHRCRLSWPFRRRHARPVPVEQPASPAAAWTSIV